MLSTLYQYHEDITPSDTATLKDCVGLHVKTTTGDIKYRSAQPARDASNVDPTIYVEKGDHLIIPGGVEMVFATGTSAAGVVGLFRRLQS